MLDTIKTYNENILDANIDEIANIIKSNNITNKEERKKHVANIKITIADNAISVLSVTPTSEVTSTNKVIIYSKDGVYRETWYASPSGITNNSNQLDRLKTVKTKIVFSDDEIEECFTKISKKKNIPVKGEVDYEKISLVIINSIKQEKVKNITFDRVNEVKTMGITK